MTQGRDTLLCGECGQWVAHSRGFLTEHSKNIQRGELVTGSTFCDGSNTKPPAKLKTVTFNGLCTNCVSTVRKEFKETYPGSLDQYGGVMTVQCPECGPEGDYCSTCDHPLTETSEPAISSKDGFIVWAPVMTPDANRPGCPRHSIGNPDDTCNCPEADEVDQTGGIHHPVWINEEKEPSCPDGSPHTNVHRQQEDRPVLLTDNHVIVAPELDD